MGTPDLAAAVLRRLVRWPGGDVVAVYTQPDRPAGRELYYTSRYPKSRQTSG